MYSVEAPLFRSENEQLLRSIFKVMSATKGRGIVAIDRGGDRRELLIPFVDKGIRFVVRERGDRHVLLREPGGMRLPQPFGAVAPRSSAKLRSSARDAVVVIRFAWDRYRCGCRSVPTCRCGWS